MGFSPLTPLAYFLEGVRSLGAALGDVSLASFGRDKVCAEWRGLTGSAGNRDRSTPGQLRSWIATVEFTVVDHRLEKVGSVSWTTGQNSLRARRASVR
jgi:hypothetical protein